MNLLLFNLATDENHVTLGFAVRWIREIAKYFDHVDVVTMYRGDYKLPANVTVWSCGKELGYSIPYRILIFYKTVLTILRTRRIHVTFTHMIQIFAVLFAPVARILRIPNVLFYAHGNVGLSLRIAHRVVDRVLSSTPEGFRIPSNKAMFVGQGIDTSFFSIKKRKDLSYFRILSVSRISKVKGLDILVDALKMWGGPGRPWVLTIVGDATSEEEHCYKRELIKSIESLNDKGRVELLGRLDPSEIARLLNQTDVFVNLSGTGSLDKAILEAMSSGCLILSCNKAFSAIVRREGLELFLIEPTPESVCEGMDRIAAMDAEKRETLALMLRNIVVRDHNLNGLITRIVRVLYDVSGQPVKKVLGKI